VGKSTLMRAIAANKVDGFPPPDKLRTVYVEHDIQVCDYRAFVSMFGDVLCSARYTSIQGVMVAQRTRRVPHAFPYGKRHS
jgi:hypothetical protein